MTTMFENVDVHKTDNEAGSFLISCKDRAYHDGERWVVASLSTEEAKRLYEYLGRYIN